MGWLSRDRVPRWRRCLHPEPRSAAARSLLSRAARGMRRRIAGRVRGRRRDRDCDAPRARLRRAANAPAPAASRIAKLAKATPAEFVVFDLLADGGDDLRDTPFEQRRTRLE